MNKRDEGYCSMILSIRTNTLDAVTERRAIALCSLVLVLCGCSSNIAIDNSDAPNAEAICFSEVDRAFERKEPANASHEMSYVGLVQTDHGKYHIVRESLFIGYTQREQQVLRFLDEDYKLSRHSLWIENNEVIIVATRGYLLVFTNAADNCAIIDLRRGLPGEIRELTDSGLLGTWEPLLSCAKLSG
jgi:hypothetical protein